MIKSIALILHSSSHTNIVDLTVHNILNTGNNQQTIGAGRVMGGEEKAEIVNILNDSQGDSFELRDASILAKTPYAIAWWVPKAKREIIFKVKDGSDVVSKSYTVMFPSMVGAYVRGKLYFSVTKGGAKTRPDDDTPLFHVPLGNIYTDGTFCHGNASLPLDAKEANIASWNSFVFDTTNTHMGNFCPIKGANDFSDLIRTYESAERDGRFPVSNLLPKDVTLGKWLQLLDKGAA